MSDELSVPDEQARRADARTALITGAAAGLALLGIVEVPVLSLVALAAAFYGWRTARPEYTTGRVTGLIGMVLGGLGVGMLVVEALGG